MNAPEILGQNFTRKEFACKCGCGFDTVDWALVEALQQVRDISSRPVIINSACRCKNHNADVGGSPDSQHLLGKAADIQISGHKPHTVLAIVKTIPSFQNGGIGEYQTFTHCDVRNGKSRWRI